MTDGSGNGRVHDAHEILDEVADDGLDDDTPLTPEEAAAAAAEAEAEADESLDERVESVVEDLDGVERARDGESVAYVARGRVFAVLMEDVLEVSLDGPVAAAALRTAGTMPSSRGKGWVAFTPEFVDRFALDRAEAWLRAAHRRAGGA